MVYAQHMQYLDQGSAILIHSRAVFSIAITASVHMLHNFVCLQGCKRARSSST